MSQRFKARDAALAVGVVALLAFPAASRLASDSQPIAPQTTPALPAIHRSAHAPQIRSLPVFIDSGLAAEPRAIDRLARQLFGAAGATTLERELTRPGPVQAVRLPHLIAPDPNRENDLAALLIIATARGTFNDGGPAALALLEQARYGGRCTPLLNLAFLVSTDVRPRDALVNRLYDEAVAACPNDPTPLWALGQYQSQLGVADKHGSDDSGPFVTFKRMQRRFPATAAAWSGQADAELRIGYQLQDTEPFTARASFKRALALYDRASQLAPGPENWAGAARALAALGQFDGAVATQRRAAAADPSSAALQARVVDYLERAQRFAEAARAAARFAAHHTLPDGTQLFAEPPASAKVEAEDTTDPFSTGVGKFEPVELTVFPGRPVTKPIVTVNDVGFIPDYVPMQGIGGTARWCPGWSRRVDLLLAGQAAAVLSGFSTTATDVRPGEGACGGFDNGPQELAAVAELELGNVEAAQAWAAQGTFGRTSLSDLEDLRQNLWRYAGNLPRAAAAAGQWAQQLPDDDLAVKREGEIAFVRGRYDDAATYFAMLVNRVRLARGSGQDEAEALLDEGTALAQAGRLAEALPTLAAATETATRVGVVQTATYAEEQAGLALLSAHDVVQAREAYALAADLARTISWNQTPPPGSVQLRPAALDNNRAVAEIEAGHPSFAAQLADQAIATDPKNPIFWWTEGWAQQRLNHRDAAIADYRTSLGQDASEFPIANDLGVLLLQKGDVSGAVGSLRRAVGANRGYALGWFNLGVALGREGPLHLLASEGSLARARQLNSHFGSRKPTPLLDDAAYSSHLDLSKPLPANWSFASSQTHAPVAAAGFAAILIVAFGLIRALAPAKVPGGADRWLTLLDWFDRRTKRIRGLHAPAVGVAATALFLLWPLRGAPLNEWLATAVFAVGVLILIAVVLRVRQLACKRVHQETWPPAVAFGLAATLAGLGWSPLPVTHSRTARVHWVGPLAVLALAVALLVLAAWLEVPLARGLGAAALVMAASLLTPVKPLDGATVTATKAGHLPALAVLGTAVLLLTGLL